MKATGIARGQWNNLCKKKVKDIAELDQKILRAYALGEITHVYKTGEYIVRYYDLNLLCNSTNILTIWRDKSRPRILISSEAKHKYDAEEEINANILRDILHKPDTTDFPRPMGVN